MTLYTLYELYNYHQGQDAIPEGWAHNPLATEQWNCGFTDVCRMGPAGSCAGYQYMATDVCQRAPVWYDTGMNWGYYMYRAKVGNFQRPNSYWTVPKTAPGTLTPEWQPAVEAEPNFWSPRSPAPYRRGDYWPSLDPMQLPIQQPVGVPHPVPFPLIPFRRLNPSRNPREQTQRGPRPSRSSRTDPVVWTPLGTIGRPAAPAGRRPPRSRERERKLIEAIPGAGKVMGLLLSVTELVDAIDTVYGTLTKEQKAACAKAHPNLNAASLKSVCVLNNLDNINWGVAILALFEMLVEDFIIGGIAGASSRARATQGGSTRVPTVWGQMPGEKATVLDYVEEWIYENGGPAAIAWDDFDGRRTYREEGHIGLFGR